jgi:hypothetical protein
MSDMRTAARELVTLAAPAFLGANLAFRLCNSTGILTLGGIGAEAGMESKIKENGHIPELSREDGRKLLDRQARHYLDVSGDEFIRRWDAGEYGDPDDRSENPPAVMRLGMLLPFVR